MGTGRSGPGVLASRFLIRRRASWKNLFWRAACFFRKVALTRKPPCFAIVRKCSHLHYSRNLRGFRVFSEKSCQPGYIWELPDNKLILTRDFGFVPSEVRQTG